MTDLISVGTLALVGANTIPKVIKLFKHIKSWYCRLACFEMKVNNDEASDESKSDVDKKSEG